MPQLIRELKEEVIKLREVIKVEGLTEKVASYGKINVHPFYVCICMCGRVCLVIVQYNIKFRLCTLYNFTMATMVCLHPM